MIGPLLGGFFVDNLSWRWIFYVNLPIGLFALAVIGTAFQARPDRASHKIDYLGAALLAGGLSAVVLYTSLGGTTYAWGSPAMIALIVSGVVLLVAFVFAERRAAEPILPLELFRNRVFTVSSVVGFIVGLAPGRRQLWVDPVPPDRRLDRRRRIRRHLRQPAHERPRRQAPAGRARTRCGESRSDQAAPA